MLDGRAACERCCSSRRPRPYLRKLPIGTNSRSCPCMVQSKPGAACDQPDSERVHDGSSHCDGSLRWHTDHLWSEWCDGACVSRKAVYGVDWSGRTLRTRWLPGRQEFRWDCWRDVILPAIDRWLTICPCSALDRYCPTIARVCEPSESCSSSMARRTPLKEGRSFFCGGVCLQSS